LIDGTEETDNKDKGQDEIPTIFLSFSEGSDNREDSKEDTKTS